MKKIYTQEEIEQLLDKSNTIGVNGNGGKFDWYTFGENGESKYLTTGTENDIAMIIEKRQQENAGRRKDR